MNDVERCISEWVDRVNERDATIAALQARVQELEARQYFGACAKCLTNAWRICKEGTPDAVEMKCSNGSTWWLCDYCSMKIRLAETYRIAQDSENERLESKAQLTQRTAELEVAQRKVDLAEKKAWLAAHDVGFFSMWNGTDHSGPPKLALLCNDTFAWATADAEDVLDEQIDTIVELFKSEGEAGVIKWIAQQRNMKPMESVGKWLFGCDAIKKERDDLQAELERVRERVGQRGLEVVMIGKVGHYVSTAVKEELERVRADNKALDKWRADVTVALQRPEGAFFVDVPQHIKDLVKERDDLRTLLLALPKVEFRCEVDEKRDPEDDMFPMYGYTGSECHGTFAAFQSKETAQAVAALLQHRQGMEG